MQASGLADEAAEEIILEIPVLGFRRNSTAPILPVNSFRRLLWGIIKMERAEVADLKLDADASAPLIVFEESRRELEIFFECRRKLAQILLRKLVPQLPLLQRNIDGQVSIAC